MTRKAVPFSKFVLTFSTIMVLAAIVALSTGGKPQAADAEVTKAEVAQAQEIATPAETSAVTTAAEPVASVSLTNEEITASLEAYGWMVGQQAGFEMDFTGEEKAAILRGIENAAQGNPAPVEMKALFPKMQEYLSAKEQAYRAKMTVKMAEEAKSNELKGEEFLAGVATQEGVQKTESGLYYKVENAGAGASPSASDMVTLHYTGKLIDGTVFDSSVERGAPIDLPLFGVIPGFSEGLQLLKEGGKATLYIPASLAYGDQAAGPIPAGSTLIFEVELLKILPKAAEPEESPAESEEVPEASAVAPVPTPAVTE